MAMIKCVKNYSEMLELIQYNEFIEIAKRYKSAKNYFYSRYSGINSLNKLNSYKKDIRDVLIKEDICNMFNLQARQWKLALDEAISNIKSNWSNAKNKIKIAIARNINLSNAERHYLNYILKADNLLYSILTRKEFIETEGLLKIDVKSERKLYLYNLLRRYVRRYKGKISHTKKATNFQIDADMYNYIYKGNSLYIEIAGLKPRKRLLVKLKDHYRYKGNLTVIINSNQTIKIHKGLSIQEKSLDKKYFNIIGIDKGYTKMLSCSNGVEYGVELGKLLSKRTEELKDKNAKRNQLYALAKKYAKEGNDKKAQNIIKNNLGYIKKDRETKKFKAKTESYINHSINQFIKDAKPMEVIKEDLTFTSKKRDKKSKAYNRKMSMWVKGTLNDRLEYKLKYNGIKFTDVNPAYTSQTCHKCGQFGIRDNDIFTCPKCGTMDANINASINILNRKDDKEIKLTTSYKEVKNMLESRAIKNKAISNLKIKNQEVYKLI